MGDDDDPEKEDARRRRGVQRSFISAGKAKEEDAAGLLLLPGWAWVTKGRRTWPDTATDFKVAGAPNFLLVVETRPIRQAEIDIIILERERETKSGDKG